jgi:hypothetical protein
MRLEKHPNITDKQVSYSHIIILFNGVVSSTEKSNVELGEMMIIYRTIGEERVAVISSVWLGLSGSCLCPVVVLGIGSVEA